MPVAAANTNNIKIGYVEKDKIYQQHPIAVEINESIQKKAESMQQEFEKKAQGLDPQKDQKEIQQLQEQFQNQFNSFQNEQQAKLEEKINPELEKIRKDLGLDILLDKEVVISGGEEVTEEVMQRFSN